MTEYYRCTKIDMKIIWTHVIHFDMFMVFRHPIDNTRNHTTVICTKNCCCCYCCHHHSLLPLLLLLLLLPPITLVRPKLDYASTVWNSITSTDIKELVCIQQKLIALCKHHFFTYDKVAYKNFLKFLKFHPPQQKT